MFALLLLTILFNKLKFSIMKKLLLLLTALFLAYLSFSQAPVNDLIENAILIDPASYVEENLRLDLATDSGVNAIDCATTGFTKVYYKFTATANANVTATLTDMIDSSITQSFVIFYTAPDLNQTDESQFNVASGCVLGTTASVNVTPGQVYYVQVHRADTNTFSRITFNQVEPPSNDSISNAIEITSSIYSHENLRLDIAAANPGGQNGCPIGGFSTVYYKFTANTDGIANFQVLDQYNNTVDSNNALAIIYTAPNLNATSDTELTVLSNCSYGINTTVNTVSGQSYYVLVYRAENQAISRVYAQISQDVDLTERQALIDLYNAADGPNWDFNTNWNTSAPVSDWVNVEVDNGHVTSVGFPNSDAPGYIPSSILDLTYLETFTAYGNQLSGEVPDFSTLPNIDLVQITSNNFSFADLEPNFTNNSTIPQFIYQSQKAFGDEILYDNPTYGLDYTLEAITNGTNLNYQWVTKDSAVQENIYEDVPGATNPTYTLTNLQEEDLDNYTCLVTSPIIPELTLERALVRFRAPVSQQERDALIALYNSTDGDNWVDNTNWLTSAHVDEWAGISTEGNRVTIINRNFQNLNGQLPDEIGDLIHLKELRISVNANLTGSIPSTIGNLTELRWLRLQLNGHTGSIPTSVSNLTNLSRVYLQDNQLTGTIPSGFGNASNMYQLFLDNNQLDGDIPSSLGNLSALVSFGMSNNNLSGTLPSELSGLTSILLFDISNNDINGVIPDWSAINDPGNASFNLTNNYFDFSDLEPFVNNGTTYSSLEYSPQRTLDQEEEIMSPPGVDIELNVDDVTIDRNLEDNASSNLYQWYKDNTPIDGANSSIYTIVNAQISDSGIYHCEITNSLLPDLTIVRADITVIVDDSLSVENFDNDSFILFPNPAKDWLTIKTKHLENASAKIFNVNGQLLLQKPLTAEITTLAIDQLSAGTYIIKIDSNHGSSTKQLIKQ